MSGERDQRDLRVGREQPEPVGFSSPGALLALGDLGLRDGEAGGEAAGQRGLRAAVRWLLVGQVVLSIAVLVAVLLLVFLPSSPLVELRERLESWPTPLPTPTQPAAERVVIRGLDLPSAVMASSEEGVELAFQVLGPGGEPVDVGTVVRFEAAGGTVDPALEATVQGGKALTRFWPDPNLGRSSALVVVRVGPDEQAFTLELSPPPQLSSLQFLDAPARVVADTRLKVSVWAKDSADEIMAGVRLVFSLDPPSAGRVEPAEAVTGSLGGAIADVVLGNETGMVTLTAEALDSSGESTGVRTSVALEVVAEETRLREAASKPILYTTGDDEVELSARVTNALDEPVAGQPIQFAVLSGDATLRETSESPLTGSAVLVVETDGDGLARVWCRGGVEPGEVQIRIYGAAQEKIVPLLVQDLEPTSVTIVPDRTDIEPNGAAHLTITVYDQMGVPMPELRVRLGVVGAQLGDLPASVRTDLNGAATAVFSAGYLPGQVTITATAGEAVGSLLITISDGTPTPAAAWRGEVCGRAPDGAAWGDQGVLQS